MSTSPLFVPFPTCPFAPHRPQRTTSVRTALVRTSRRNHLVTVASTPEAGASPHASAKPDPNTARFRSKAAPLQVFQDFLVGSFDNRIQLESEKASGPQLDPFAQHVNGLFHHRVSDLPARFDGIIVLTETYLWEAGGAVAEARPLLLHFRETADASSVEILSLNWPRHIVPNCELRNDNPTLQLSYNDLAPTPTFPDWVPYAYDPTRPAFSLHHTITAKDYTVVLDEVVESDQLTVMEDILVHGKRVTKYSSPLLYQRATV